MISIASKDAFSGFVIYTFNGKNISVVVVVMIGLSLIEYSMFFSNQNHSFMYKFFSQHIVESKVC